MEDFYGKYIGKKLGETRGEDGNKPPWETTEIHTEIHTEIQVKIWGTQPDYGGIFVGKRWDMMGKSLVNGGSWKIPELAMERAERGCENHEELTPTWLGMIFRPCLMIGL